MKTIYLRLIALCLSGIALLSLFAFSDEGGGNGGGADGREPCPPGFIWDDNIKECMPQQWILKPCYTVFGESSPENGYYATCQDGTAGGILMECGAITPNSPLSIAREFQCLEPLSSGGEQ